jgi:hypothetical protein
VNPIEKISIVALTNTAVAGMTADFPLALRRAVYAEICLSLSPQGKNDGHFVHQMA